MATFRCVVSSAIVSGRAYSALNAPVRLDAMQLTDQQLQKNSTQRIREVIDQLRSIEPPKRESEDPDKLN